MSATLTPEYDGEGKLVGMSIACSRTASRGADRAARTASPDPLGAGDVRFLVGTVAGNEWFTVADSPAQRWKRVEVLYDARREELIYCGCGVTKMAHTRGQVCAHGAAVAAWVDQRRRRVAWEAAHGPCPDGSDGTGWE